jgi:hypothetical protein
MIRTRVDAETIPPRKRIMIKLKPKIKKLTLKDSINNVLLNEQDPFWINVMEDMKNGYVEKEFELYEGYLIYVKEDIVYKPKNNLKEFLVANGFSPPVITWNKITKKNRLQMLESYVDKFSKEKGLSKLETSNFSDVILVGFATNCLNNEKDVMIDGYEIVKIKKIYKTENGIYTLDFAGGKLTKSSKSKSTSEKKTWVKLWYIYNNI